MTYTATIEGCQPLCRDRENSAETFIRAVYDKHGPYLLRYASGLAYGDRHQAEDLVQETVLRAWRSAATLDPLADGIRTWLIKVLRNLAIDRHRARRSRPPETTDQEVPDIPVHEPTDAVDVKTIVHDAMKDLSLIHREILIYVKFLDYSVGQTAQLLGIPPGTVKSRTYLALKALQEALAKRGFTP
ncbi:sigma-70 family RNA polymerase sigma factor [Catenulispora rubra]|uniref:sigma-70 family RNA polymerase sigma factor n=1 Tax=Catenulispora rubra TaxID=280293 RepID=UPI0018925653|nr:sigma-70 family RNA polymerase sigma factor [Catenulispora rubra]